MFFSSLAGLFIPNIHILMNAILKMIIYNILVFVCKKWVERGLRKDKK